MGKNLIFEIGTEELPSLCLNEGIYGLKAVLENKFIQNRIGFKKIEAFGTPRRIVVIVKDLDSTQKATEKIITGPPKRIAFKEDNSPTKAALGFAKSLGLLAEELEEFETERGIYVGKKIIEKGKNTTDILPQILKDSLISLSFSKQMSWGNYNIKFARPIRWILALCANKVVRFDIENLSSGNVTYGHRTLYPEAITVEDTSAYLKLLEEKGKVIIDPEKRKKIIVDSIKNLEKAAWNGKFKVVLDKDLLDEVVNLVEIPNVLVGNFPQEFLYISRDILIKVIQHHQRYFAVVDEKGNVCTKFIVIQNGIADLNGEIIKGNQRVLRARLSDASYFYLVDKKHSFEDWFKKLDGVIFFSGIGTLREKAKRLEKISIYFTELLKDKGKTKKTYLHDNLKRASVLCKCDLVTNMVVEFPELQGIVGREYAKEKGENKEVYSSIYEHYLPRFSGDILPETDTGAILSISDKIDTISGMFLLGNIPSGSEDPFALRRKASGIVLTTIKKGYDYNLKKLIDYVLNIYVDSFNFSKVKNLDLSKVSVEIFNFIIARYRFLLERQNKRLDILDAILGAFCTSIMDIDLRYKAILSFLQKDDIDKIYLPMLRCKNITKGEKISQINPNLIREDCEEKLFLAVNNAEKVLEDLTEKKEYSQAMIELKEFGNIVDNFFDDVLVMDGDRTIRENRISLVKRAMDLYLFAADFSKLVIDGNNRT